MLVRKLVLASFGLAVLSLGSALGQTGGTDAASEESWYTESAPAPQVVTPTMIIQQKAQIRGAQRMDRLAALQWYGFSNARPLSNATPFTGMYSPQWQMPGGRPMAWTPYRQSTLVIVR